MQNKSIEKVTIIGDGGWGTALGVVLARNNVSVTLWSPFEEYARVLNDKRVNVKFLPGFTLPESIDITHDMSEGLREAQLAVIAIPSHYIKGVLQQMARYYDSSLPVLSVVKGIEVGTLKRMSEVISEILRPEKLAILSGPSHAEEVAGKLPATVVIASDNEVLAEELQRLFITDRFRVYTSDDCVGIEIGGALKNVIAIAAGICDGLKFGSNAKAALLTRGMVEITRLGIAMGGKQETFYGLSGIGDLITTCISPFGRNRSLGEKLAKGQKLKEIVASTDMVMEGMETAKSVSQLAEKYEVEMPISQEVYNVIYEEKDPLQAVQDLMLRVPKPER